MPYGLGGGFSSLGGGSVGGAIAQGLQSGFEMGRQVDADKAAREQRAFENARQTAADARAAQAAELVQAHNELAASKERLGMLATEGAGLATQYGGDVSKIPVDVSNEYATRASAARKSHGALLDRLTPHAQEWRQSAQDDASKMQTGQLDPMDPKYPPAQLVHTLTATARRPLQDFMPGAEGQPAPVKQMVNDFQTGLQTNNEGLTLKAVNGLFAPELKTGVGQPSPHGGVIVGKQIVKLVPAPPGGPDGNDPNAAKVTPVLRVFVREGPEAGVGEAARMASNEQAQYGAPPGATGHYDAPVTQNRSTDPNDPIAHISMDEAMNRVGQIETLASAMEHPELQAKVKQGMQEAGDAPNAFLQSFYAIGGKMPTKQETYENVPIGPRGTLRVTKNAQGIETSREMLNPPPGTAGGPLAKKLADIEAADLSDAEKADAVKVAVGLKKVKAGGGEGGAGAPSGIDKKTVDFYATQSISGDNAWQVGLARGKVGQQLISAVKDRIPKMAEELGLSPQDVGTNKAQNVALTKTLVDRQKYVTSVEQLNGTLTKQADLVESLLSKGAAGGGSPVLNKWIQAGRRATGDADVDALNTAITGLAREHQRVLTSPLSNAQLHAAAQATGDSLINDAKTPAQIRAVIKVMRQEAQNGLEQGQTTLESTRQSLRGLGGRAGSGGTAPAARAAPAVGAVQGGYRFKGGNPADQSAWEKVQ